MPRACRLLLVGAALLLVPPAFAQPNPPPPRPPSPNPMAIVGNDAGYDMAPETRPEVVAAAVASLPTPLPSGPVAPTWDSLRAHYRVPSWFVGAKFGLMLHWGLYAIPARHNEWYQKHMYSNAGIRAWHIEHFGPLHRFGYKDFIPLFTAEKFDPAAWAALFKRAGARYVIPTAQHHDNFALWASNVTRYNARTMGPRRDLIGELATAVRAQGLKFGVSNHGIENFQFINPSSEVAADLQARRADLYDPAWADFYSVADRSDAALTRFLHDWYARNVELIDKYRPDLLWFDNGIDIRYLDPLKLRIAAHYYNRAAAWGQEVSISTKKAAFAPSGLNDQQIGSILDFEKVGSRSPAGIRPGVWQVDDAIGSTWGYTDGMRISSAATILTRLIDTVSKNGTYLLNLSPRADGSLPQEQQQVLLEIGRWLETNGEAIYDTHAWTTFGSGGGRGDTGLHVRYTVRGDALYAILINAPAASEVTLAAITSGRVTRVQLLGAPAPLPFRPSSAGLLVKLPPTFPTKSAVALKITGLQLNPPTWTRDGNP
jgi:alpha-L-fucosidase